MIGCIVQARTGSTRLPRKTLLHINGNDTVLTFCLKQIFNCKLVDKIVVATTTLSEDDELVNLLNKINIPYFRGHPTDVLDRYYQCAKKFSFSSIVRITSDCPLIDPNIIDKTILKFLESKKSVNYASNVHPHRTFPHGTDVEVFSFKTLKNAWENAQTSFEREHVTPYMYNNKKFKLLNINHEKNLSNFRWTVDYEEDLELIRELVSRIKSRPILINDIIKILLANPKLLLINKNNSNFS